MTTAPTDKTISLNVLSTDATGGEVKKSRSGRWRAFSLLLINAIIAARLAWWLANDQPAMVSPVEPSESLAFSKDNVVNAGLIFFLLMIVTTMIFGRFFCGWACHFLALQDGARWILLKLGIRPKPLRSRMLGLVPLGAFLYMFIWPLAYRAWLLGENTLTRMNAGDSFANALAWANQQPFAFADPQSQLIRTGFWDTFPGIAVAIATFAVAGGFIVYALGSKGFCFYACPYGGIFAPVDKLAPGRIRVNEDCTQTGHCTSVCSSNVRVHAEVRDYGMVVDPGCMKCLDCVSVCPNDALRWGFGKPAIFAKPRKKSAAPRSAEYTRAEELALGALFLGTLYAIHSLYGVFPFLFSLGLAAILAYALMSVAQTFYKPNVRAMRLNLKLKGDRTPIGKLAIPLTIVLVAALAHSAFIQHRMWRSTKLYESVAVPRNIAIAAGTLDAVSAEDRTALTSALSYIDRTIELTPFPLARQEIQQAWLSCAIEPNERFHKEALEAATRLRAPLPYYLDVARAHQSAGRIDQAEEAFLLAIESTNKNADARAEYAEFIAQTKGELDAAAEQAALALETNHQSVTATTVLARLMVLKGEDRSRAAEMLANIRTYDAIAEPDLTPITIALVELNEHDKAIAFLDEAGPKSPAPERALLLKADVYRTVGRVDEAKAALREITELPEPDAAALRTASEVAATRLGDLELALAIIENATDREPMRHDLWTFQGDILEAAGKNEDAKAAYTKALGRATIERDTAPGFSGLHADLGGILARLGRFEEAKVALERATEITPNSPQPWQILANVYLELGETESAQAANEQVERLLSGRR